MIGIGLADIKMRFSFSAADYVLTSISIYDTFTWSANSLESFGQKEVTILISLYEDFL